MGHETVSHTGASGGPTESVERTVDGVTVRKSFEKEEFPVPAVRFEISSARTHTVEITIVDDIPPEIDMEQVGFHPQYHSDQWTPYPEGQVEFQYELPAHGTVQTIYGVQLEGSDPDVFLQHPSVSVGGYDLDEPILRDVDEPEQEEPEDQITMQGPDATEVVREVVGSEPDTVTNFEPHDHATTEYGDPEPIEEPLTDTDEPTPVVRRVEEDEDGPTNAVDAQADQSTAKATDGSGATVERAPAPQRDGSDLAAALATALREDRVDDADRETIESALGGSSARDSRVSHLQSRVSDLEAYTDALEAFIDENGTAQEIFDDVETELEATSERITNLEERLERGAEERSAVRQELEDAQDRLRTTEESVDTLEGKIEGVTRAIARIDRSQRELADTMESLEDDLGTEVEDLEEEVDSAREEIDAAMDEVDELAAWRDQLTTVLGANADDQE